MKPKLLLFILVTILFLTNFVKSQEQSIDAQEPQEVIAENLGQNLKANQEINNNQVQHINKDQKQASPANQNKNSNQKEQIIQNNPNNNKIQKPQTLLIPQTYQIPQMPVQYESNEKQVQKQERQFENQQLKQMDQKLHSWVAQQLDDLDERGDFYIGQQFNLPIQNGLEAIVRWNPQKHQIFKMEVYVLGMDSNGDIFSPQNPQQDENIEIQVSLDGRPFKRIGKVYVNKILTIDFSRSDMAQIKFKNNYANIVILTVDLQGQQKVLQQGVNDDQFKISRKKMVQMMQQMQQTQMKRQNRYKWEWGFKDKQLKHQEQMLSLTGVQLFVIIVTAIIQMYCIKNLLDNRSIV